VSWPPLKVHPSPSRPVLLVDGVIFSTNLQLTSRGNTVRVTLYVESGPKSGRRIRLLPNQLVHVGRTNWAEFTVPGDEELSDVHFSIATTELDCRVCDLDSQSGTFVNGARILEGTLKDGDRIHAGSTVFLVEMSGRH
jgi:pSer/pThr/pTyr-binding forkhead associated (FHA) protein